MVARDPSKPKASHLDDLEVLTAIDDAAAHGVYPGDYFPETPGKVFAAKTRKLMQRGLVQVGQHGYSLTQTGREALLS